MGSALARNIAKHGFKVSVWNRTHEKVVNFINTYGTEDFYGAENFEDFVESIQEPRRIILMVPAGQAVEEMLIQLKETLRQGDAVLEGGNSFFADTESWIAEYEAEGIHLLGCGISGGEQGALNGPSLMPGGSREAYEEFADILKAIAAEDFDGHACTAYMGKGGAGHYIKMIHNGIEYAEMQALAEAYDLLKSLFQLGQEEIAEIFEGWKKGDLDSFLLDISVELLQKKEDGQFLLELILDRAEQKGTGRWSSEEALQLGIAAPSFTNAVFARALSSQKETRLKLAESYPVQASAPKMLVSEFALHLEKALIASRIAHFEQGLTVLAAANKEYGFELNLQEVLRVWQGGCIIRSKMLKNFSGVLNHSGSLYSGLWTEQILKTTHESWKKVVSTAIQNSIPVPALSAALTHFESMRSAELPAHFIQGLRDCFGSHGYERRDKPGNFHSQWI
jgi:6-phosphogluconate dehydrogenase